jgi:hypothetical protein
MNEQLQAELTLDLAADLANGTVEECEIVDSSNICVQAVESNGLLFAAALKARASASRPIAEDLIFAALEWSDLKAGKSCLQIQHRSKPDNRRKPYYSTTITNRSTEKIRIDRFGTYLKKGRALVLHSITGGFFGSQQFQEWYQLGDEWLEPGQVVTDPNNHSQIGVYWAYFGTTASGKEFVTGAAWNGKRWWQ